MAAATGERLEGKVATVTGGADREVRYRAVGLRAIKRVQTPDDLVGVLVFLCSADRDFMSGQLVNVDGGSIVY